jgi:uncharacterized protein (DUF2252 family)
MPPTKRVAKTSTTSRTAKKGAAKGRAAAPGAEGAKSTAAGSGSSAASTTRRRKGTEAPSRIEDLRGFGRTVEQSRELGREARRSVPRSARAGWEPDARRRDPVQLLVEQNETRVAFLVPVRHGRMSVSPFTFYRGTARVMAADLVTRPTSGLSVQLGGDAHLSNFGAYASPSRQLVFDQNDFDETLAGPWEWDVERLAASFFVAGRHLGFTRRIARDAAITAACSYRESMHDFAAARYLDLWYDHTRVADIAEQQRFGVDADIARRIERFVRKAQSRTSLQALGKLAENVDGSYRLRSQAPLLVPLRDLADAQQAVVIEEAAVRAFDQYKETLRDDRRVLVDRYTPIDLGLKVVGVGSVGTMCLVMLLQGRDAEDPLFLQVKEATASVLEDFLVPSEYPNHGQRVVEGQRLIQAESDTFLGWTQVERHFYVRQLRDWKASVDIEAADPARLTFFAKVCGRVLARGHARSGDAVAIAAYLGQSDSFDKAIGSFSESYEKQVVADYEAFTEAIRDGRIAATDDAGAPIV